MANKKESKTTKRGRVKVGKLQKTEKEITSKEMKKVKGGTQSNKTQVAKASADEQF